MPENTHQTRLLAVNAAAPEADIMQDAAQVINDGGLVAFPTETVYGLGANGLSADAVARIFAAKGRPSNDPIILHISEMDMLPTLTMDVPEVAFLLAENFWSGALTLVLKRSPIVPEVVSAGLPTVAIRMPAHPVALALIRAAGVPIAAPSANTFSRPSPTTAAHVLQDLDGKLDLVLDGGSTSIGVESTIVDLSAAEPRLLRPGGVTSEALREIIPNLVVEQRLVTMEETRGLASPGQLLKHYSPQAEVCLLRGDRATIEAAMQRIIAKQQQDGQRVGLLAMGDDGDMVTADAKFHLGDDNPTVAARLFAGLRQLDAEGVDVIVVRQPQLDGVGLAIWDRLLRAAEGRVIDV